MKRGVFEGRQQTEIHPKHSQGETNKKEKGSEQFIGF
jgi:hypothetical protein